MNDLIPWGEPLRALLEQFALLVPRLLIGLIVLVIGWIVAGVVRQLLKRLLGALGFERVAEKAGISAALRRGMIRTTFIELIAQMGYWIILMAAAMLFLQSLGLGAADEWLRGFSALVPRVLLGAAILLLGAFLSSFLGSAVRAAGLNAGLPQGYLLGQSVSALVMFLAVIIALEQLHVVTRTIEIALYITLGAVGLAGALAVGLGGQDLVRRVLDERWERRKTSHRG